MTDYSKLLEFCITPRQIVIINAITDQGNHTKAAKVMGVTRQTVDQAVRAIKQRARMRGYDPDMDLTHPSGEGLALKRVSTNYNGEGEINQQWVIYEPEKEEQMSRLREFCAGLMIDLPKATPTLKPTGTFNENLLSAIVIGDGHLGMLANKEDNLDADFNIEIATSDLRAAIEYLVASSPPSEECLLVNVGDFLHHDNTKNATPGHGHALDVCTRHPQALRIAAATLRYLVDRMAEKFPRVRVVNATGNHDPSSAIALSMFLEGVYENHPRVIVEPTQSKFYFLEFGKNLIGITHGDQIPAQRLAGVMTRLASEQWGRTQWRRWWVGHIHHKQKLALDAGCTVESFNTLAGTDAWHAASGYGGERGIELITLHREYGEIGRLSPSLEMIRACAQ